MKKFKVSYFLIITAIFFSIVSCKKSPVTDVNLGYSYYPDNVGHEIIYDVDSMALNEFDQKYYYSHYQIKEVIDSIFSDNQGRPTMRIERYRNDSGTVNPYWVIYNVWTANKTSSTVERFENNIRYLKLIFPVDEGSTWNGNSMNTLLQQDYEYTYAHNTETINGLYFDSVTIITQLNDTAYDILYPSYEYEKFATGIGMVNKLIKQVDYKINNLGVKDTFRYLYYEEKIKSYKK